MGWVLRVVQGNSFQISVFRIQLRQEKEKTSADFADYQEEEEGKEKRIHMDGQDKNLGVFSSQISDFS